jgi:hypothetical protein
VNSPNSLIEDEVIQLLLKQGREKSTNAIPQTNIPKQRVATLTVNEEVPAAFFAENIFAEKQTALLHQTSPFENRVPIVRAFGDTRIDTIFDDFEAFSICAGLEDRYARKIARQFFADEKIETDTFLYAHKSAMRQLERLGPQLLTYFISLPPLPFQAIDATQLFSEFDKRKQKQDFPVLRITYYNHENRKEKIHISFFAPKNEEGRERNENVLVVKNKTTGAMLMRVSRNGVVLPEAGAKEIVPSLLLFIRFSENVQQFIINYGIETGQCSICGRELSDLLSIKLGIGPICRAG